MSEIKNGSPIKFLENFVPQGYELRQEPPSGIKMFVIGILDMVREYGNLDLVKQKVIADLSKSKSYDAAGNDENERLQMLAVEFLEENLKKIE